MNKSFTKKITKKNIFYIILICFILSVIPLYVIGMYAHPSVDDYYYGTETVQVWNETHSFASVVKCSFDEMINTYNIWQGNFSAIFLMRLQPGIFGEQYYFIAPLILLSAYMGFSIFFFYTALKKIFKADSYLAATVGICLTFVSMQLCATPSDSFYWFNGAIYYTFFYSLMLFLFALLIRMRTAKAAGTIILTAISSVSAFLIGGSNYAAALFMCIILALSAGAAVYFVILRKNKVIRPYHMAAYLIVAAAAMAGLFISMAAPGNALRQQSVGGSTGIVKTFVYTFAFGGYSIAKVLNAPCLIFFICMIPVFYRIARRSGFTYRYPLLVAVFTFGLYCSMGTPVFYAQGLRMPYRMMNIIFFAAYVLITFNLIYFLGWIGNKFESKTYKQLIGGSTASYACGMQGYKFESKTFKQLIGGNTASNACSMQGYKYKKYSNEGDSHDENFYDKNFCDRDFRNKNAQKITADGITACEEPSMIKTDRACIILEKVIDCFFEKIKASRKNALLALAISLCAFIIACIGCIEVGETEYKSGDAGFGKLPLSAAATLSLINGDAKTYDCELTARDEYLRSTSDDEQFVTVPALSKRPAPIYHSDITDDPGDWHNAHVAMYYRKECIWTE